MTLVLSGFMWDRFQRIDMTAGRIRQMRLAVIPTHDDDAERNPDEAPAVAADSLTEAEKSPTHDRTSGGAGPQ